MKILADGERTRRWHERQYDIWARRNTDRDDLGTLSHDGVLLEALHLALSQSVPDVRYRCLNNLAAAARSAAADTLTKETD